MADLSVTAANVLASASAVVRKEYNAGATITAGQCVYLDSSSLWQPADANVAASAGLSTLRGIALAGASNGQPLAVCTSDTNFTPGATLNVGSTYVVSPTAGGLTLISNLATGTDYPQIMMSAITASKAILAPYSPGVLLA